MGIGDFYSRFKTSSVGGSVSKGAPDFCTVYVISKGKVSSVRNASRSAPSFSPLHDHLQKLSKPIVQGAITPRHKFLLRGLFFVLNSIPSILCMVYEEVLLWQVFKFVLWIVLYDNLSFFPSAQPKTTNLRTKRR